MTITIEPPDSPDVVAFACVGLQALFNGRVPNALLEHWSVSGRVTTDIAVIFPASEILDANKLYNTADLSPGFITIGNDSGGVLAYLSLNEEKKNVYLNYFSDRSHRSMRNIGMTLQTWIENGCPFDNPEPLFDAADSVVVQVDETPASRLLDLLSIRDELVPGISLTAFRQMLQVVPFRLPARSYCRAVELCIKIKASGCMVSIWGELEPSRQFPTEYTWEPLKEFGEADET